MLRELGQRLVDRRLLDEPEDVFWLRATELTLRGRRPVAGSTDDAVERRREVWRGQRRATPPQVLPEGGLVHRLFAGCCRRSPAARAGTS